MDGHKHGALTDEALEWEIEAALGVDPSPEFLPNVRARIANERMREGWLALGPWRWTSVVAGVMVVVVAGLWSMRGPASTREVARVVTPPVAEPPPSALDVVAAAPEQARPVVVPVVRTVRPPRPAVVAQLEIVISPDESAALRQLFVAINDRRIETKSLPDLTAALKPPDPIEEIALEPITISPLASLEGE